MSLDPDKARYVIPGFGAAVASSTLFAKITHNMACIFSPEVIATLKEKSSLLDIGFVYGASLILAMLLDSGNEKLGLIYADEFSRYKFKIGAPILATICIHLTKLFTDPEICQLIKIAKEQYQGSTFVLISTLLAPALLGIATSAYLKNRL